MTTAPNTGRDGAADASAAPAVSATVVSAPLVSVVTAAFNARAGVEATAASVAGQTGGVPAEHIVVDGASTDGTVELLESLGPGLRWISEPDSGIAEALNKGVAMARGDYILVLQAGDVFLGPESLAAAARHLDGPGIGSEIVSLDVLFETAAGPRRLRSRGFVPKLAFKTTILHQGAFCHRRLFERIGGFDETIRVAMDYDFFLRAWRAGAVCRRVPEILARMPDDGVSSRTDWPSLKRRFDEERRIHLAHCPGPGMRAVYALYWPLYMGYRRLRAALAR